MRICAHELRQRSAVCCKQKFVYVYKGDPVCVSPMVFEAMPVGRQLPDFDRPITQDDGSVSDKRCEHFTEIVGGEIVVQVEFADADVLVKVDPIGKKRRFFAEYRAYCDVRGVFM